MLAQEIPWFGSVMVRPGLACVWPVLAIWRGLAWGCRGLAWLGYVWPGLGLRAKFRDCSWPAWVPSQVTPYPGRAHHTQARPHHSQARPRHTQPRPDISKPGQATTSPGQATSYSQDRPYVGKARPHHNQAKLRYSLGQQCGPTCILTGQDASGSTLLA